MRNIDWFLHLPPDNGAFKRNTLWPRQPRFRHRISCPDILSVNRYQRQKVPRPLTFKHWTYQRPSSRRLWEQPPRCDPPPPAPPLAGCPPPRSSNPRHRTAASLVADPRPEYAGWALDGKRDTQRNNAIVTNTQKVYTYRGISMRHPVFYLYIVCRTVCLT